MKIAGDNWREELKEMKHAASVAEAAQRVKVAEQERKRQEGLVAVERAVIEEEEKASAAKANAKELAANRERRALEARRAREALQAEVGELEKAIAQLERDEQKASAAVDAARKELGGIAPEDRENADAVVKSKQRVLDKIKAKKEGLEGSLAILKKKSQGGKRFTRRRKTRRRR
jgi:chromosome segregation ATPase